ASRRWAATRLCGPWPRRTPSAPTGRCAFAWWWSRRRKRAAAAASCRDEVSPTAHRVSKRVRQASYPTAKIDSFGRSSQIRLETRESGFLCLFPPPGLTHDDGPQERRCPVRSDDPSAARRFGGRRSCRSTEGMPRPGEETGTLTVRKTEIRSVTARTRRLQKYLKIHDH